MAEKRNSKVQDVDALEDDNGAGEPLSFVVLKTSVYLMGVILIVGFAFLAYTLISRSSNPGRVPNAADIEARLPLEQSEEIRSISLERNMLAVHVRGAAGGDSIVVYDLESNSVVRRIAVDRPAH